MPISPKTDSSSDISAPPSPATTMSSTHGDAHPGVDNSLDDIFGSSPPETREITSDLQHDSTLTTEPSDLPSLRRQHVTAGYRDGVSMSKGEHVQRGFDAGFPVGAQLGMRAGTILGILEGITRGLEDRSVSGVVKKPAMRGVSESSATRSDEARSVETADSRRQLREKVLKIYLEASKALDVQAVFAGSDVQGGSESSAQSAAGGPAGEPAEAQLGRKGEAAISKWELKVAVPQWEKNMEALEMKDRQGDNEGDKGAVAERS